MTQSRTYLCLPGAWMGAWSWKFVLEKLHAAGHEARALPFRGVGERAAELAPHLDNDVFVADTVEYLESEDLREVVLVGHSFGSLIAQHVAVRAPERVHRLVLVGSAADPRNAVLGELRAALREMDDVPADFVRDFQHSTVHRPVPPAFMRRVVAISAAVPRHVWLGVADGFFAADACAPLARIATPTLLLWGDRDGVFDRAQQERLLAGIAGASLRVYAGTGHAPHWEEPERFAREVVEFVGGR